MKPIAVEPEPDELLSSFLARNASQRGLGAYSYCAFHIPHTEIWNRDLDRTFAPSKLAALASGLGLQSDVVAQMTLRRWAFRINGSFACPAVQPWINVLGVFHRDRHRFGLQYCPVCLESAPYFRRAWRLSFYLTCPDHGIPLVDACPHCDRPIIVHWADVSLLRCHACGAWLSRPSIELRNAPSAPLPAQSLLISAVTEGTAKLGSRQVSAQELFKGIRMFLLVARQNARHRNHDIHELSTLPKYRLELMRSQERRRILAVLNVFLEEAAVGKSGICTRLGMTRRQFTLLGALPDWITPLLQSLPPGGISRRTRAPFKQLAILRRGKHNEHAQRVMELIDDNGH